MQYPAETEGKAARTHLPSRPAQKILLAAALSIKPLTPEPGSITLFCIFLLFAMRTHQPGRNLSPEGPPACQALAVALTQGEDTGRREKQLTEEGASTQDRGSK